MRLTYFIKNTFVSSSTNKDIARKTFILNILLSGSIFLALVAFIRNCILAITGGSIYYSLTPPVTFVFLILLIGLFVLSRKGYITLSAVIFISFLFISAFYTSIQWGADVPQAWLMFALIIIVSGILVNTRFALLTTLVISVSIIFISFIQLYTPYQINFDWKKEQFTMSDTIVRIATLIIIVIVSWLSNREIEKSLKRARASERELKQERDQLEIKVEERTKELKRIQLEKMTQVYRFAEIGRLTSGFMHDLVSPISLISLNLHQLNNESQQKRLHHIQTLLNRAIKGTRYLENFVITARKQLQNHDIQKRFSLNNEIKHVIQIITYKANMERVKIIFEQKGIFKLFGNPIKFNQIIMNLILNAIDSYDKSHEQKREVKIFIRDTEKNIQFNVQDFGVGIPKEHLNKIFDPFFTTKTVEKGTGIGLSITQDIIKQNFSGKIFVKSGKKMGTIFTVVFPKIYPKKFNETI